MEKYLLPINERQEPVDFAEQQLKVFWTADEVKVEKDIQDVLAKYFNKTAQNEFKAALKAEGENDFPFSVSIEFEDEKESIDLDEYAVKSLKDLSMSSFTF